MQVHNYTPAINHTATTGRHLYEVPERLVERAPYVPAGRTLHLVDVDNLLGGPSAGVPGIRAMIAEYVETAPVRTGDHVIAGACPRLAPLAGLLWPSARVVTMSGPEGADLALLEAASDTRFTASRYDQIIVGSGDFAFRPLVDHYTQLGIPVGLVARPGSVANVLVRSATFVRLMTDSTDCKDTA